MKIEKVVQEDLPDGWYGPFILFNGSKAWIKEDNGHPLRSSEVCFALRFERGETLYIFRDKTSITEVRRSDEAYCTTLFVRDPKNDG